MGKWMDLIIIDKGTGESYEVIVTEKHARIIPLSDKSTPDSLIQLIEIFRQVTGSDPKVVVSGGS